MEALSPEVVVYWCAAYYYAKFTDGKIGTALTQFLASVVLQTSNEARTALNFSNAVGKAFVSSIVSVMNTRALVWASSAKQCWKRC